MTITRVRWRERQRLAAADLRAEQDYRLHALGRHHVAPHEWGVVRGLWLIPGQRRLSTDWHVSEGVAIDGYGRELRVARPIDFTIPAQGAFRIFLYYCEARVSRPPCAACADDPLPRIGQYVQVGVEAELEGLTGDGVAPELARAAGPMPGYPAWPVLLGVVRADGGPAPVDDETRYHRQRASLLRAPSGRALLRLGLLGPEDAYHALLSTASGTPQPIRRLAIDRDGQVHAWRPLAISGPKASGLVQLSQRAMLAVEAEMPTGIGRRVLLTGRLENPLVPLLTVNWRDTFGLRLEETVALKVAKTAPLKPPKTVHLDEVLRFGGGERVAMKVLSRTRGSRTSVLEQPKGEPAPRLIAERFEIELTPSGGRLELSTLTPDVAPPSPSPCDPEAEGSEQPAPTPTGGVLHLLPAAAYTPAPATRELYAQSTPAPDGTPGTECRISGGAFDDGDRTSRIGFGMRMPGATAGTFKRQPLLTVDGGGRVAMPCPGTVLQVGHTLQLPPITTDPADPLTQDLLALAYNAGLWRVGKKANATVTAAFTTTPTTDITIGHDLTYTISVSPNTAIVKRLLEVIVGITGPGDVILRNLPLTPSTTTALTYNVTVPRFFHRASDVKLQVHALVSESDKDCAAKSDPVSIHVTA
jgi:hypothetical protein